MLVEYPTGTNLKSLNFKKTKKTYDIVWHH